MNLANVFMCMHVCMYSLYVCMQCTIHMCACYVCVCIYVCMCMRTYICVCMHAHIHTCIHDICIYVNVLLFFTGDGHLW